MFTDYFDIRRPRWDGEALAALQKRLEESGYQGLTGEFHAIVRRYVNADVDRTPVAILDRADEYADVLIPPAHPSARVIFHRRSPEILRVVVAGRTQHEARMVQTALKLHLEAVLGRLGEAGEERGQASVTRFRREVVPALHLNDSEPGSQRRNPIARQVLRAMQRQPAVRGRPTILASQANTLASDKPAEEIREALDQLVGENALERWHVVLCKETGQWLGSSSNADAMRSFSLLSVDCPHCGRPVSNETTETAYRLSEKGHLPLSDNQWLCDLIEAALRRLGVEAVAVHPGGGVIDGAACYQNAVILFRATDTPVEAADLARLQEEGRRLQESGWRVFSLVVSDRPISLDAKAAGVTVVESTSALDATLGRMLRVVRDASVSSLLPTHLRLGAVPLVDLLPAE